jgi:transposase
MHRGPHPTPIQLSTSDRETLTRWLRQRTTPQALALRARIILTCASRPDASNTEIANDLGIDRATVRKWRRRFTLQGPDGLADAARPGAPRRITESDIERVLAMTLEGTPPNGGQWSTRSMARATGLSQTAVSRIWRSFALRLHGPNAAPISRDTLLIEQVRNIVGLYLRPPDRALVLAVDTKHTAPPRHSAASATAQPDRTERYARVYIRHSMMALFAALDVKASAMSAERRRRHRGVAFRRFLDAIDRSVPPALDVHVVLGDASTERIAMTQRWLAKRPRFHVHVTPTASAWLSLVEWWFALLTARRLKRGSQRTTYALEHAIEQYIAGSDAHPAPFVWMAGGDDAEER